MFKEFEGVIIVGGGCEGGEDINAEMNTNTKRRQHYDSFLKDNFNKAVTLTNTTYETNSKINKVSIKNVINLNLFKGDSNNNLIGNCDGNYLSFLGEKEKYWGYRRAKGVRTYFENEWRLEIREIYSRDRRNNTVFEVNSSSSLSLLLYLNYDEYLSLASNSYFKKIKEVYFSEFLAAKICSEFSLKSLSLIQCSREKFTEKERKKFPNLFIKSIDLEYVFELNYDDLFMDINDTTTVFALAKHDVYVNKWMFGMNLLKKFQFDFDVNEGVIGLYVKNEEKKRGILAYFLVFVIVLLVVLGGIAGVFVGRKLWKRRKLKANELEDEFNYKENKLCVGE